MNEDSEKGVGERPGFSPAEIKAARDKMRAEHPEQFAPQDKAQVQAEINKQVSAAQKESGGQEAFIKNPNAPISGQETPVQIMNVNQLTPSQEQGRLATLKNRIAELIHRKP